MSDRGNRKTRQGFVSSDKMEKTVVVKITRRFKHPLFKKYISRSKKYKAHDEANECRIGDEVLIEETRPISRNKHWRVKEVIRKAV